MSDDLFANLGESDFVTASQKEAIKPLSVTQLNLLVKSTLEQQVPRLWVAGEITDLSRPSSGHIYFTLKDKESQIRAVIWRTAAAKLTFKLEDGMAVHAFGGTEIYVPRGTYQFIANKIEPQGEGALQVAFRQLHAKLSREGLFDPGRKKPLPVMPRRVGFVTSPSGAALKDFLEVVRRRWSHLCVVVIPARVQGVGSVEEIVRGIQLAPKISPSLDVLVVGRGGGSLEDLWSFNDERVVRAVAACPIPTVSAVGHEIDVTLCDLAADVRALTPSEAAERIAPSREELLQQFQQYHDRITNTVRRQLQWYKRRLIDVSRRAVLERPQEIVRMRSQTLDQLEGRIHRVMRHRVELLGAKLSEQASALEALSPLSVLTRGYSITQRAKNNDLITSSEQIELNELVRITLKSGTFMAKVDEIRRDN
jgi:exodeoxyribonuclease VII large subunit